MDLALWIVARAAGLAAYAALCISVLSGLALRTTVLDGLAEKRPLRALHDFTTWVWLPFGVLHVVALMLDTTARIGVVDAFVPFHTPYGQLAIGLGTTSFDIVAVVVITSVLRRRMSVKVWRAIHRLSYAGFVLAFMHSILSGTDLVVPLLSGAAWATGLAIIYVTTGRVAGPRKVRAS